MKSIYCIVVTYNGIKWIEKCLHSLVTSIYPCNIIVVDNDSSDRTAEFARNAFPHIQLIEAGRNLGFGQANNLGLRIAIENKADYVFLLNQDAWIEPDTISSLIRTQTENPGFGIISPVHLNGAGTGADDYFLDYFLRSDIKKAVSGMILDNRRYTSLINTGFVNAAAWLITGECLRKTGGFDPIFFHYGEDRNYMQRVHYWGFKTGIHLASRIYHDREIRISTGIDARTAMKREWLHFLDRACDIQKRGYFWLICRRFLRYSLQGCLNLALFNRKKITCNFYMAKNISQCIFMVRKSRLNSLRTTSIPHLGEINFTY